MRPRLASRLLPALCAAAVIATGARADDNDAKLDAIITTKLQSPGARGDALRAFHACVVNASLKPGFQGVMAVYYPGQPCAKTATALHSVCMRAQHNKEACDVIVLTTSKHAEDHAGEFK